MWCHVTIRSWHNSEASTDIWNTILLAWNDSEVLIWLTNLKHNQQVDRQIRRALD